MGPCHSGVVSLLQTGSVHVRVFVGNTKHSYVHEAKGGREHSTRHQHFSVEISAPSEAAWRRTVAEVRALGLKGMTQPMRVGTRRQDCLHRACRVVKTQQATSFVQSLGPRQILYR